LTGGDLSGIPTTWFSDESDDKPELNQKVINKEFTEVMDALKNKEHVIIGHNLFTDLVCLYTTFIGPLPKDVDDFQDRIRGLFPTVIDTKYLATEGHDSMSTVMRKSLGELLEPFKTIHMPLIVLHEEHTSYGTGLGKKHEAGFDSWMTAELFVKLTSKIYADRKRHEIFDSDSGTSLTYSTALEKFTSPQYSLSEDESVGGGAKLDSHSSEGDLLDLSIQTNNGAQSMSMSDNLPSSWHANQLQKLSLNDCNPFSVLQNTGEGVDSGPEDSGVEDELKPNQWIPRMESSFWDLYANKLRVNASDAGVCDLNDSYDE
jgi:poly(A)-specific ribonuclease